MQVMSLKQRSITKTAPHVAVLALAISWLHFSPASAQANCPVINGRFVMDAVVDGKPKRSNIDLYTRVSNGVHSYATARDSPNYQAADGIPKTTKAREYVVKLTVRCTGKNTLEREVLFEDTGQKVWSKITPVDNDRIRVESSTPAASGIHVRE